MRKITTLGCLLVASCARSGSGADSAGARDSAVIAGAPAVPATTPRDSLAVPAAAATPAIRPPAPATSSKPPVTGASPAVTDSLRGIVSVVGTSFDKRVMLAVAGTGSRMEIIGPLASLVGHLSGAEVRVVGKRDGTRLEAVSFLVASVDGQAAIDGTLKTEGTALYIITAGGTRTRIAAPPPPLRGQDGARVWITGDPSKGISSFGFIDPPR